MWRINKHISTEQLYGSGLAAILICLLLYLFFNNILWVYIAIAWVILTMTYTRPVKYFAIIWLAFGEMLGFFVSRLMLTLVFGIIVIPVSLFVRKRIRYNMQLHGFNAGKNSVFKDRNHVFSNHDFEKPF